MENCPVSEKKLVFHNGDIKLVNTANIQITYSYDLLKVRNREYDKLRYRPYPSLWELYQQRNF